MSNSRFESPHVDLAAVDGEVPTIVPVLISRDAIEQGDYDWYRKHLHVYTADRETFLRMRGRVVLTVDGYDDDPRDLCVIDAFQAYAKRLLEVWPSAGWFMMLVDDLPEGLELEQPESYRRLCDGVFMQWLLANACPANAPADQRQQIVLDDGALEQFVEVRPAAANGAYAMALTHQAPVATIEKRLAALSLLHPGYAR